MKFLLIACVALSTAAYAYSSTTKTTKTLIPAPTSKEGPEPLQEGTMKMDKEKMPGTTSRENPAGDINSEIRTKKTNATVTE